MQQETVPPLPGVRGTWNDQSSLKRWTQNVVSRVGSDGTVGKESEGLARMIDHTMLKPDATRADIERVCREAVEYGFASVCINTTWLPLAVQMLRGSRTMAICVVGFPLGAAVTTAKAAETREAIRLGAEEIDMVVNIGALKSGDHDLVLNDIRAVVKAAQGRPVKVILETKMLSREEKIAACALSKAAGAAFVKTSTGFGGGGATAEDIALMRQVVGPDLGVKASGGVRSAEDAASMIKAGATRLGASASIAIVTGGQGKGAY
ncbi:MAG: deoxyribose-phosphate aldolase [Proteobacteria bacterium]|nr:deoxyribose-phosphate aldolase [Pseudomonadota bacterium]MCP4921611.1 deoxyribose-phosphate aldolase [Pseudomonadota bacterium]